MGRRAADGSGAGGGSVAMSPQGSAARSARGALWVIGLTAGLVALRLALLEPGLSSLARSPVSALTGLAAGWSLIIVGLVSVRREPGKRYGAILSSPDSPGSSPRRPTRPAVLRSCSPSAWSGSGLPAARRARARSVYPSGRLERTGARVAITPAYLAGIVCSVSWRRSPSPRGRVAARSVRPTCWPRCEPPRT